MYYWKLSKSQNTHLIVLIFLLQTDSVFGHVLWMTIYTLVCSQIILGTKFSTMPPYGYTVHTANDIAHSIVLPSFMLNSSQNWNFYNWSCHNPCLQKTDSAIYIHDDHLYLERVAALTTISFKENGYQSCHVTKIKRVIHGWKWFVKTLNTDIKRLVGFFFTALNLFGSLSKQSMLLGTWQSISTISFFDKKLQVV